MSRGEAAEVVKAILYRTERGVQEYERMLQEGAVPRWHIEEARNELRHEAIALRELLK